MTTDRELLTQLFTFLKGRNYITMEDISLTDMVKRYQNPPLTAYHRVAMQMTTREYNALAELMKTIEAQLKAEDEADEEWIAEQKQRMAIRTGKTDAEQDNPETGAVLYKYDDSGQLVKTRLAGTERQSGIVVKNDPHPHPFAIPASDEAVYAERYDEG